MNTSVSYPISKDTPVSHLPFSPAVRVGDLIFVSGQASVDAFGKIILDTFEGIPTLDRKPAQGAGDGGKRSPARHPDAQLRA
jgi:hypothetical protein